MTDSKRQKRKVVPTIDTEVMWCVTCEGLAAAASEGPAATAPLADWLCLPPLSGLLATGPGDIEWGRAG